MPIANYCLPLVIGRAEPQKGGGIAQAWISDPKVYPGMPVPNDGVHTGGDSWLWWIHAAILFCWLTWFHWTTALIPAQWSPYQTIQIGGDQLRNQRAAAAFISSIYHAGCQLRRGCFWHFQSAWHENGHIANSMACSIIGSRINYCSSLLHGASNGVLENLQRTYTERPGTCGMQLQFEVTSHYWSSSWASLAAKIALTCYKVHRLGQPCIWKWCCTGMFLHVRCARLTAVLLTIPASKT